MFYNEQLCRVKDHDTYFVIDKIQKLRIHKDELQVLIDWKYFPPSDSQKNSNWFPIHLVDDNVVL